jgi:hypothetical protein
VVDDVADAADSQAMLVRLWGYEAPVAHGGAALVVAPAFSRGDAAKQSLNYKGDDSHAK